MLIMWDVGGQEKICVLWYYYFIKLNVLIFVVDSSDFSCILEVRKEFQKLFYELEFKDVKLLVYVNKQDVQNCFSFFDLIDMLDLLLVDDWQWYV